MLGLEQIRSMVKKKPHESEPLHTSTSRTTGIDPPVDAASFEQAYVAAADRAITSGSEIHHFSSQEQQLQSRVLQRFR